MMGITRHLTSTHLPGPLRTVPIVVLYSTAADASAHFVKTFAKVQHKGTHACARAHTCGRPC